MAINQFLDKQQSTIRTIFISSYVPRRCGIATFTKDLTKALNDLNPEGLTEIIAVDQENSNLYYPWEVKYRISDHDLDSYYKAAEYVNQSSADIVCVQHEYGLFGGMGGEYLMSFLRNVNKPVVSTLHTVLEEPDEIQRDNLMRLAELSCYLVVMIPEARDRLVEKYGIDAEKIAVIHHGVGDYPKADKFFKKILKWNNKRVLLSTGLISRDKGLEYVIKALPAIVKDFPDAYYYVVGQTHPGVLEEEGEKYRNELTSLAKKLNVSDHVVFVNRYLDLPVLMRYYEACDIFITPHLNEQQVSSGTLAYGLGMGKPCISTPYLYAKTMLSNGGGMLAEFRDENTIADSVLKIFNDPNLEIQLSEKSYKIGRSMCWPRVAQRYLNLFRYLQNGKNHT